MSKPRKQLQKKRGHGLGGVLALAIVCAAAVLVVVFGAGRPVLVPKAVQTTPPAAVQTPTPEPTPVPTPETTPEPTPTPKPTPKSVLISAAGDVTIGGDHKKGSHGRYMKEFKENGKDYGYFLKNVKPIFEADDVTIVNLEGPLTTATKVNKKQTYVFKADPEFVDVLTQGSVEVANIANNHANDYLDAGKQETVEVLAEKGIAYCGEGYNSQMEVNGIKLGFLGFRSVIDSEEKVKRTIAEMRPRVDVLIASFHWGIELEYSVTKEQKQLGRAAVDAGADLVLGHHPHVVSGIEKYKGKHIVYSLGNFSFGGHSNPKDKDTFVFQQRFTLEEGQEVQTGEISVIPCSITSAKGRNNYQPTPYTKKEDIDRVLQKIRKYSKGLKDPAEIPDVSPN